MMFRHHLCRWAILNCRDGRSIWIEPFDRTAQDDMLGWLNSQGIIYKSL
jgi:hypothetical protein